MSTPEFILHLREKIGHDLLWLPGVTGVVFDASGRVLLVRRSDDNQWTLVTGCLDPGEQPALGIAREIFEETAVNAAVERVIAVESTAAKAFPNGDNVQFIDIAFRCRAVSGVAMVNDDESVDVRWFALNDLPELPPRHSQCIRRALEPAGEAWFESPPELDH
jgi:8-oxo-dGTP pyrophosphatase MutT (NUDIX family)